MNRAIALSLSLGLATLAACGSDVQLFDPEPRLMPQTVEVGAEAVYDWVPGQTAIAQLTGGHGTRLQAKYSLQGAVELWKPVPVTCDSPTHCLPVDCTADQAGFSCSKGCPSFVDYTFTEQVAITGGMVNPRPRAFVDNGQLVCSYELSGNVLLRDDTPVH